MVIVENALSAKVQDTVAVLPAAAPNCDFHNGSACEVAGLKALILVISTSLLMANASWPTEAVDLN